MNEIPTVPMQPIDVTLVKDCQAARQAIYDLTTLTPDMLGRNAMLSSASKVMNRVTEWSLSKLLLGIIIGSVLTSTGAGFAFNADEYNRQQEQALQRQNQEQEHAQQELFRYQQRQFQNAQRENESLNTIQRGLGPC